MIAVGEVTPSTVRIWLRSERPGTVVVTCRAPGEESAAQAKTVQIGTRSASDQTGCVDFFVPRRPAAARARCEIAAVHQQTGREIGSTTVELAPSTREEAPDRFSVAWMSCHQPFDAHGLEAERGVQMLEATLSCLESHDTKMVFMLGDQMYTDYPKGMSLFDAGYLKTQAPDFAHVTDAPSATVRELLQRRYRHYWNIDAWKRLHAKYPCYPVIDDHEIVDNWGSHPDHEGEAWQRFLRGARAAYYDYQGSRVIGKSAAGESADPDTVANPDISVPRDFDYEVAYGPVAAYAIDLRTNRRVGEDARVVSETQFERLTAFLERQRDRDVVMIALSVPLVHLPRWAAKAGRWLLLNMNEDFSDRWSTAGHLRDRNRLFEILRAHQRANPLQRVVCISGDIHIACSHEIGWSDGTPPLLQLISSGITKYVSRPTQIASRLSILAKRTVHLDGRQVKGRVRVMPGEPGFDRNPFTGLNLGLLEFRRRQDGTFEIRSLVYGHRGEAPVCMFRSAWR